MTTTTSVLYVGALIDLGGQYDGAKYEGHHSCLSVCPGRFPFFCTAPADHEHGDIPHISCVYTEDPGKVKIIAMWDTHRAVTYADGVGATL
jgi:hypothetical protein